MAPVRRRRRNQPRNNHNDPTSSRNNETVLVNVDTPENCTFSTNAPCETKVFTWKIENFKMLIQIAEASEHMNILFDAGASIGVPSKWRLFSYRTNTNDDISLFLQLVEHKGPEKKLFARYDAYIKRPDGEIFRKLSTEVTDLKALPDWGWRKLASITKLSEEGIITNDTDSLTIHINFVLYGQPTVHISQSNSKIVSQLTSSCATELNLDFGKLLENAHGSDVIFQVLTGEKIKAHKTILLARSPVFYAALGNKMKEQNTGVIVIEELSAKALRILLKYIYTGSVDADWGSVADDLVYSAYMYNLLLLKQYLDNTLATMCNAGNALKLLKLAKLYSLSVAIPRIADYIKSNVDGVLEKIE